MVGLCFALSEAEPRPCVVNGGYLEIDETCGQANLTHGSLC
jgi:hypothetical protein